MPEPESRAPASPTDGAGRRRAWLRSKWTFFALCLALGFVVRLIWILKFRPDPVSDSVFYYRMGIRIADGQGYGQTPTAWRTPGYPAFLAVIFKVFGPKLFLARIANVFLALGTMLLSYSVAKRLFRSELAGRITMVALALWPNNVAYSSLIASEPLFLFLIMLGVWLVLEGGAARAGAAGLALGAATLVRPAALVLPLVLFFATWVHARRGGLREHLFRFAVLHTVFVALLVPWLARNQRLFGRAVMANESGVTLMIGNNPLATGAFVSGGTLQTLIPGFGGNEYERSRQMQQYALRYIRSHPGRTLALIPTKFWYTYRADNDGAVWNSRGLGRKSTKGRWLRKTYKGISDFTYRGFGLLFVPAAGFVVWRRRRGFFPSSALLGFWLIVAFVAIYLPLHGQTRFHFPVIPWLTMYVAAGVASLWSRGVQPGGGADPRLASYSELSAANQSEVARSPSARDVRGSNPSIRRALPTSE